MRFHRALGRMLRVHLHCGPAKYAGTCAREQLLQALVILAFKALEPPASLTWLLLLPQRIQ